MFAITHRIASLHWDHSRRASTGCCTNAFFLALARNFSSPIHTFFLCPCVAHCTALHTITRDTLQGEESAEANLSSCPIHRFPRSFLLDQSQGYKREPMVMGIVASTPIHALLSMCNGTSATSPVTQPSQPTDFWGAVAVPVRACSET